MSSLDEVETELVNLVGPIDSSELENYQLKFYKLDGDLCKSRSNRNCQSNARCLRGLGQSSWVLNPNEEPDNNDDLEQKGRLGPFCGLKNLGATCYINTFLQLWFHNSKLRNVIYNWRPNHFTNIYDHPITCLQVVMSMMQFSHRPFVDPTPFIQSLSLDASQEQDTHEFANLFIAYIQNRLGTERDKSIQNTIDEQYRIEIDYTIQCQTCGFTSNRSSPSHELFLRVKGFKTIYECIGEYLKEQELVAPNQYACQSCGCLQDAIQTMRLRRLPPIVNLQLLRFESTNGMSKKISSYIKFPDQLDMNHYINSDSNNYMYNLAAVLVHEGQTSYSGHYITYIKRDNFWYKFNDESVKKLKDFNFKDDNDEELLTLKKKAKSEKDKDENGMQKSKSAYMLVYRLASESETDLESSRESCNLPDYLIEHLDMDNQLYVREREEFLHNKKLRQMSEQAHQKIVKDIYKLMEVSNNSKEKMEAINKNWFNFWFKAKVNEDVPSVENQGLLCSHEKLDMDKAFKCISETAASVIASQYTMDLRIPLPDLFCNICTKYRIYTMRLKQMMDNDSKEISNSFKFKNEADEKMFWVGKESFKNWKSIKLNTLKKYFFTIEEESAPNEIEIFNKDIICSHGKLCSNDSKKRLVCEFVWNILRKYFPDSVEADENTTECDECLEIDERNQAIRNENCELASVQKSCLQALFNGETEQNWEAMQFDCLYYFISVEFYSEWKRFVQHPTAELFNLDPVKGLLCEEHLKFLFPLYDNDYIGFDKKYICLTSKEWDMLNSFYNFTTVVSFKLTNESLEMNPGYCHDCFTVYTIEEHRKRFTYENVIIHLEPFVCNGEQSFEEDSNSSKMKSNNEIVVTNGTAPLRRSKRKRKQFNLSVTVSSTTLLKEIKMMLYEAQYSDNIIVSPLDLKVYYQDKLLSRDQNGSTLGELLIEPESILYFEVDDPNNLTITDTHFAAEAGSAGFKGTQLAHL